MNYEQLILSYMNNLAKNLSAKPLVLGGAGGSGGGYGGPVGGFVGYLPQARIAYDVTESGNMLGSGSLLDNLNHIRGRISTLESGYGNTIKLSGVTLATGIDTLDFYGPEVTYSGDTATIDVRKITNLRIGDDTNFANISTTGNVTLSGAATAFEDLRIEPVARTTGTNAPAFEQWFTNGSGSRGAYLYSFDDAVAGSRKEIFFTMQMPHAAKTGSPIYIHIHWIPNADGGSGTSEVRWGLEYNWTEPGAVFGNTTIIYVATTIQGDSTIVAKKHYISSFVGLTPTSSQDGLSSILIGRLFRDSSDAADTYTDKVGLLYIDAHYEVDSFGSNSEYIK